MQVTDSKAANGSLAPESVGVVSSDQVRTGSETLAADRRKLNAKPSAFLRSHGKSVAIGCLLVLLWGVLSYGWWPLRSSPVESDAVRISCGTALFLFEKSEQEVYRYESQAGTYETLVGVGRLLKKKVEPLLIFRLLTIASFIIFAISATEFLHRLLGCPRWFCLVSLLLFQETFIASYYPNSNMLAIPWATVGLALLACRVTWLRSFVAGLLFGVGIWMRFDLVLICLAYPVVIKPRSRQDWYQVALLTFVAVVVSNGLIWISGVSLSQIFGEYRGHAQNFINVPHTLRMYSTVFTALTIATTVTGGILLWRKRQWQLLALVLVGVLPTVFAFGFAVTTPKYLLYSLTFACVASTSGLWYLLHSGNRRRVFVASLFALQYIANPFVWFSHPGILDTDDMSRRIGGIYASSAHWHDLSQARAAVSERMRKQIQQWIERDEQSIVVMQDYTLNNLVPYYLLHMGYRLHEELETESIHALRYKKQNHKATLVLVPPEQKTPLSSTELESVRIRLPSRIQVLGYLNPAMLPTSGEPRVRATGKFGTYEVSCSVRDFNLLR